ncbi:MAG TPA: hypothetical protein VES36_07830, partial [Candidatus Limnocylindrales bacterium]|nr:hypothetical protein [Candidatus Limnocylindrales bacterium]
MLEVARRVRLTLPGTLFGLATSVAGQDDPLSSTTAASDPAAIAWVEPVVPEDWEAPQEPTPADEDWKWDADGLLSVQGIYWGDRNQSDNELQTKTATVIVTARHGDDFLLWFEPDFDGEDTRNNLSELWGEWTLGRDQWLRVGQFKVAMGTEFATRAED